MLRRKQGVCSDAWVVLSKEPEAGELKSTTVESIRRSCAPQRATLAQAMSDDEVGDPLMAHMSVYDG